MAQAPGCAAAARVRTACHHRRDSMRGIVRFVVLAVGHMAVFLGIAAVPGLILKLAGSCVLFVINFHLALLGHDAGHGSLTRSARLNRWLGRLALLPSYAPFSAWVASHNALHHAHTNLRGKDPIWAPLSKEEYDALSPFGRALERFMHTLPGVLIANLRMGCATLIFPLPSVLAHIPRFWIFALERWAVLGWLAAQIFGLWAWERLLKNAFDIPAEPVTVFVTAILLPFVLMNWWTGLLSFMHHTHPKVRWYADREEWRKAQTGIECTVHLIVPNWLNWLFGNALEHTAHHVAPKANDDELSEIQHDLEEEFPEVVQRVRLTDCLRILACCKLYDYENHRWVGYDGKPTT